MIRIGITGYAGRMGQAIAQEIALNDACNLSGGVVRQIQASHRKKGAPGKGILITTQAAAVIAVSDVIIDFSLANAAPGYALLAASHGKPFVSGTTGLDADGFKSLKEASAKIPVLYAPNTSLSFAVMKQMTTLASKLLKDFDYDISIMDEHHRMKRDAPSGAAQALGDAVFKGNSSISPAYSSVRAGHIIGEHEVMFGGHGEIIRLHHSVTDRGVFARGAVQAALWIHGKPPGLYGMEDVLGLKA